jgi:hypothetical protein
MKYLILSKNNSKSEEPSNTTLIDASNMEAAKNILHKSLNRKNINEEFEIIDLLTSDKKSYVVKKNKN